MNCREARLLLDGYSDGELDLVTMKISKCTSTNARNAASVT